jgi:hypothetical protein
MGVPVRASISSLDPVGKGILTPVYPQRIWSFRTELGETEVIQVSILVQM